ncbi:MFS transporter [Halosegnis sp.]|uniref:MFS transporter n=1 Tax=Halosegnis sp. TaxID=2864959 RepID=UPI0035D4BB6C
MTERSRARVGALVAGGALISAGLGAYEIAPAGVTPLIRETLGVSASGAGLLVSVMFGTAVIASLPVGFVLDRVDSRRAVAIAVGGVLLAGAWGYVAGTAGAFRSLLASRVLGGLAYVVVWNAGIEVTSEATPAEYRATAVGTFTASGPVGFALGQAAGPRIAAAAGWPAVFPVFTGVAALGLVAFWPASRGLGRVAAGGAPSLAAFGGVLRSRSVWLVGSLGFLGYALYLFVNSWGPTYLTESVGLSLTTSGALVALFPAVGILSRVSGGAVSDRIFGGRRRPVVLGSFLAAAPLTLVFARAQTVAVLVGALLLAGVAVQLTLGLAFAYVRELVDPAVAATAVAFQTAVGLAGAFVAPIVGGAVIETAGYQPAFLLAAGVAAVGAILALWAPEPGSDVG